MEQAEKERVMQRLSDRVESMSAAGALYWAFCLAPAWPEEWPKFEKTYPIHSERCYAVVWYLVERRDFSISYVERLINVITQCHFVPDT
jgi:hypothetical protein